MALTLKYFKDVFTKLVCMSFSCVYMQVYNLFILAHTCIELKKFLIKMYNS